MAIAPQATTQRSWRDLDARRQSDRRHSPGTGSSRGREQAARRSTLPEGYRKARRVMDLAERLQMPLVTLIDTPGAYPGVESEARGLASELAGSLARMSTLRTPIVPQ